jgi:GDP-4-dehydro-6-deoxy-D-mannose reductase
MTASRRVLITGGSGFVGQWTSRGALERGWSVFAGTLEGAPISSVLSSRERDAICWLELDVSSESGIAKALHTAAPDVVVHLAGIAFPPEANAAPARAFEVNVLGAQRLLAALGSTTVRTLVIGSAEQYGLQDSSAYPIPETATLRPLTPYSVSKAAQELVALMAHRAYGADVICTRSFNHSGVGHAQSYLLPSLVRRARELPPSGGTLQMGNGTAIRDYLHVADVAEAYLRLLESGKAGEVYNVSSGQGLTVHEIAERVLKRTGVTADISSESTLLRPIDVPILVGDNAKLRAATGWAPRRSIDDIIDDLIHAAKS